MKDLSKLGRCGHKTVITHNTLKRSLIKIKIKISKKTKVLPLVSYLELEQDCQILEFQNYNVV
jgi:hypothetical protein